VQLARVRISRQRQPPAGAPTAACHSQHTEEVTTTRWPGALWAAAARSTTSVHLTAGSTTSLTGSPSNLLCRGEQGSGVEHAAGVNGHPYLVHIATTFPNTPVPPAPSLPQPERRGHVKYVLAALDRRIQLLGGLQQGGHLVSAVATSTRAAAWARMHGTRYGDGVRGAHLADLQVAIRLRCCVHEVRQLRGVWCRASCGLHPISLRQQLAHQLGAHVTTGTSDGHLLGISAAHSADRARLATNLPRSGGLRLRHVAFAEYNMHSADFK
jgi:hypothetical protein